ncbi:membrane dipeptidase [Microdochium trichocladiopsis]|uniref:Dipeptidase n=1 Tax=Microdochium trichocladiopsis TaxID=1682393 RepID=A0A9P8XWA4_9PEZI|nr:membrane dipeptidase [Microdochium trichocladiopsis]KAH7024404.1 membrane dipeptidase [Microdochium trichocladiopsis]
MEKSPLVDTHIDLPQVLRSLDRYPLNAIRSINASVPGHVDIPRLREGRLGGAFWTVWTPCPELVGDDPGPDFNNPTHALRDAFEMLDLIQNMIAQHPEHLQLARSSADITAAFRAGRIASLLGMEGTHFLGNSLSSVRVFAQLGVRYLTLTHVCHSAFASSNGGGGPMTAAHEGNGLSPLGDELVRELNRLGVMVDLSHTSDATARQALRLSRAPVVWTHSGSRALQDHPRNVPDDILALVGDGPGKNPGVIQSVFYPPFIGPTPETANVSRVADHIEYIARIVGKKHVGIASDFDGMYASVQGLEDASKYPVLVAEMLARGWSDEEVLDLMGRNLMRVMDAVDAVKEELKYELPSTAIWEKRKDLPATWGEEYYPYEVRDARKKLQIVHDEL